MDTLPNDFKIEVVSECAEVTEFPIDQACRPVALPV